MIYSLPYLFLLVFFGLCALSYENSEIDDRRKTINIIAAIVFYIFFAFRGYLFTDWLNYVEYFEQIEWSTLFAFDLEKMYEPGFVLLSLICKSIIPNYFFFVVVCITIDTFLLIRFLRRRNINNFAFVFFLFIVFEGLSIMFNLLRNAISIFIFINALEYIEKRKPLPYFSLCLLAVSFHLSAIIFFPLYFFLHRKTNKWVFIGCFLVFFILYMSKISIVLSLVKILGLGELFTAKIEAYTETFTASRIFSITGTVEKALIAILVFLYYDEIFSRFKNREVIINSLLLYFFMYYLLADFTTLSDRFSILFVFSYWVIWIDLTKVLYLQHNKYLLTGFLFVYCLYNLQTHTNMPCQEYDNILFGYKSYPERLIILNRTYESEE